MDKEYKYKYSNNRLLDLRTHGQIYLEVPATNTSLVCKIYSNNYFEKYFEYKCQFLKSYQLSNTCPRV